MIPVLPVPRDRWISTGVSVGLHACLLLLCWAALRGPAQPAMVIFSVETVPGVMPQGVGSGAQGAASQISNQPSNLNPMAGGLNLAATDAPLPQPKPKPRPRVLTVRAVRAPSLSEVDKLYQSLKIGVQPNAMSPSDQPSQGGMGDAHQAGTSSGLAPSGAIAGRGYRIGNCDYGKNLPEESEVVVLLTVDPRGEVLQAQISKTSGYPALDQFTLTKSRDIVFDPLPPDVPQVDKTGTVTFRFEYDGKAE